MNFERQFGVGAQRFHLIGKEQQVMHVMAVGHVDVEAFGKRFDAPDFRGEVRQIGGPK
jgi:hypothetical protein